jgi:predicted permease
MSGHDPRLSRLLIRLLRVASSRHAADAAVGDILEDLDERRRAGGAPRWPAAWLNRQIVRAIVACAIAGAPRVLRSAGHVVRDAGRAVRRAPAHALFILLILAAGMSAATVTFSVVDAVVLRPLAFDDSEAIVAVSHRTLRGPAGLTPEEFWTVHDRVNGFDSVGTRFTFMGDAVTIGGIREELTVSYATAGFFRVLRVQAVAGRVWTPDDERRDPRVAVIAHRFWQRRFGGGRDALGAMMQVGTDAYRIIGVLPPGLDSSANLRADVWVPRLPPRVAGTTAIRDRVGTLARVRPGVSLPQVTAEIESATASLNGTARPPADGDSGIEVRRWRDTLVSGVRPWMLLALGCVGLVVLIACVNAANVMLARSFERSRELAVRASLGASRRLLALTLLAESLMLSIAATVCALAFAVWGVDAVKRLLPPMIRSETIALDRRVFAASMVAAMVTGILFGLVPAWQASRVSIVTLLKDAGTTATAARRGWRSALLTVEVACIAVLLVVSTLFIASFVRVVTLNLGLDRSNLIAVLTLYGFEGTVGDVKARLAQLPGVSGVAAVDYSSPPLVSSAFGGAYITTKLRTVPSQTDETIEVQLHRVTPDYFAVTRIPFRRGSMWSPDLPAGAGFRPMVIDELTARSLFGDRDPVGVQIRADRPNEIFTVVGIVPFVFAHGPEPNRLNHPSAYFPLSPTSRSHTSFFVRTAREPDAVVPAVVGALTPLLPDGKLPNVRVADEAFRVLTPTRRFNATVMSWFAFLALLIGAAGVYGVIASSVAQQTREIGVRVALGATPSDIRAGVLAQTVRHLVVGLAVGLPVGWWVSRGFATLLFEVTPRDLTIYAVVACTLMAVGLIAAFLPARRASRVDPIVSLRTG